MPSGLSPQTQNLQIKPFLKKKRRERLWWRRSVEGRNQVQDSLKVESKEEEEELIK